MILKAAIKEFLNRPLRDWRPYKKLTDEQLERMQEELPVEPPLWRKLKRHQKIGFIVGAKTRKFAFLSDTGTGKTLMSIALGRYFRKRKVVDQILVLVPNRINKTEWAMEMQKHSPVTSIRVLQGSSKDKWAELRAGERASFTVETYAGFVRMLSELQEVKTRRGKKRNKLVLQKRLIKEASDIFDGLILDEVTACKNHDSLAFRVCRQLRKRATIIFTLTATPFGRDPIDLWSQFYLIDRGQTLGPTLGLFRQAMFRPVFNGWAEDWYFNRKYKPILNRMLANSSLRFEARAVDLPKVVHIVKTVELPDDAETLYRKARNQLLGAKGNKTELRNAFLRLRQISSGFVGFKDDETGERAEVVFKENPKLEMLMSVVETVPEDQKIVILHDFIFSGDRICEQLDERKIKHLSLYGETKDPDRVRREFDSDRKCRVLVLSNSAGGFGLNLQVASYLIYYESPVSLIMRKQTRARVVRQHSAHERVFVYDLVTKGTADERILEFHRTGEDLFRAIVNGTSGI